VAQISRLGQMLRQTKISQLDNRIPSGQKQHILRLQIEVADILAPEILESGGELLQEPLAGGLREPVPRPDEVREVAAAAVLHDDVDVVGVALEVSERDDVRMVERLEQADLVDDAVGRGRGETASLHRLHRHALAGSLLFSPVDLAVAPAADPVQKGVVLQLGGGAGGGHCGESSVQVRGGVRGSPLPVRAAAEAVSQYKLVVMFSTTYLQTVSNILK